MMGLWWPWWLNGGYLGISSNPPRFQSANLWLISKCQGGDVGNLLEKSGLEFLGDFWVIWKMISGCSTNKMEKFFGGGGSSDVYSLGRCEGCLFLNNCILLVFDIFFASLAFKAKSKLSQLISQNYVFYQLQVAFLYHLFAVQSIRFFRKVMKCLGGKKFLLPLMEKFQICGNFASDGFLPLLGSVNC